MALLAALATAYAIGSLQGRQAERRYTSPHAHTESAKASARRACINLEPVAAVECVYEHVERSDEQAHTEQDLTAQQDTARWTMLMLVMSLIASVIGGFGLWFLRENLLEARKTVRAAVDQHRPWLKVSSIRVTGLNLRRAENREGQPTYLSATIHASIENVGSTPAVNVKSAPAIFILESLVGGFDDWRRYWEEAAEKIEAIWRTNSNYGFVLYPGDEPAKLSHTTHCSATPIQGPWTINRGPGNPVWIFCVIVVNYEITNGETGRTVVPFIINVLESQPTTMLYLTDNPFPADSSVGFVPLRSGEQAT